MTTGIKPRDRQAIAQALRAGVVPRTGLQHLQVGRHREVAEIAKDLDRTAEGGAAIRFIIGDYGAGKTFFLNLTRSMALEKGLVTLSADVTPDRRLHASAGQGRALYTEMTANMATRTKPDGGALPSVVERLAAKAVKQAETNGTTPESEIHAALARMQEMNGGYDFATVIGRYWQGYDQGNDTLTTAALRWLRGEYSTRTDARRDLGVRTIVDDQNIYQHLKLMANLTKEAGYTGLAITVDEMVNLYKLTSVQSRNQNYEMILVILNDILQGGADNLALFMGGTPDFLANTRRGLYSYEALRSRLAENTYATGDLVDVSGPVIRLANLSAEDMFILLSNIRNTIQEEQSRLPDEALIAFMESCNRRIGDAYFRTPRNTVTEFVNMLAVLEQNTETTWQDLAGTADPKPDMENYTAPEGADDELERFSL